MRRHELHQITECMDIETKLDDIIIKEFVNIGRQYHSFKMISSMWLMINPRRAFLSVGDS
jgi:hypothetical protein